MNALELRGLQKTYGDFTLDIGELTLPEGCVMGLVGENGAGKSTTIRLILDSTRADGGSVTVLGRSSQEDPRRTKAEIGAVLDELGIPGLTALELGHVLENIYPNWEAETYGRLLQKLSVPADKPFHKLSQGMKKKLGIAAAFSHNARLLLLDEATNGLDPVARDDVNEMLRDFAAEGRNAVLISSHIVSDLEKICDYIAFLHKGRLLLCEEKDVLEASYGLLHCPAARLEELDGSAILTRRITAFGAEAVVRRDGVPRGTELSPVGIEEIFIAMAKEDRS